MRIDLQALFEEDFAVGAFLPAYEQDEVVFPGEFPDVRNPVGDLPADGVERFEPVVAFSLPDVFDHVAESVYRFGRLRIEQYLLAEIYLFQIVAPFYHDGMVVGLSHQSVHFGMPAFAVDHDLCLVGIPGVVCLFYFSLQLQYDRAGGIDNLDFILLGDPIGFRRFAMGTQQYFYVVQMPQLVVVDCDQSLLLQAFHLVAVVYDVAQTVEPPAFVELLFGFADSGDHAEAES